MEPEAVSIKTRSIGFIEIIPRVMSLRSFARMVNANVYRFSSWKKRYVLWHIVDRERDLCDGESERQNYRRQKRGAMRHRRRIDAENRARRMKSAILLKRGEMQRHENGPLMIPLPGHQQGLPSRRRTSNTNDNFRLSAENPFAGR